MRRNTQSRITPPRYALFLALSILSFAVAGCSTSKDTQIAAQAVQNFHAQLAAEQYQAIYAATDPQFRKTTSLADLTALLSAVHRKLGAVQHATQSGWRVNWTTDGKRVTLAYETQFAGGKGTEQFVWHLQGDRALLLNYNINSNALIQK